MFPDAFDGSLRSKLAESQRTFLYRDAAARLRCGQVEGACYVKFNGQVEACCLPDRNCVGDLSHDDFLDVWHGAHYRRLRQSFVNGLWLTRCENCHLMQADDVNDQRSHLVLPCRDEGSLVSLPQPYKVTELERNYRDLLDIARVTESDDAAIVAGLQRLLFVDDNLHEVTNAMGVLKARMGQPRMAKRLFEKASRLRPDDPVVAHNLRHAAA